MVRHPPAFDPGRFKRNWRDKTVVFVMQNTITDFKIILLINYGKDKI